MQHARHAATQSPKGTISVTAIKCGHIGLTCADLERSKSFFSEIFGFQPFFEIRRKTPWLAAQVGYQDADISFCHMRGAGGMHLELLKYHNPICSVALFDDTYIPGNMHLNVWVESAEATAELVRQWYGQRLATMRPIGLTRFAPDPLDIEASTITDGPQKGGKGFYMRDPDGHTIEVWQPAPGAVFDTQKSLPPELSRIIDRMESARAANNSNWMDLIRLVYRAAPEEAKKLFRKIEAQDADILKLAQSSADAI